MTLENSSLFISKEEMNAIGIKGFVSFILW
jgi:hypothetical protein